jgi:hypothetical protein
MCRKEFQLGDVWGALGGNISWSLNPDGIRNGRKNAGAIARAMGSFRGAAADLPGFEWIS